MTQPHPPLYLSREAVRDVDRRAMDEYGLPGIVLMENAARGCVDSLCELQAKSPVVICAGKGNNGGDGLAMSRHLTNRGIDNRVLLFAHEWELRGDAAINYRILKAAQADLVIVSDRACPDALRELLLPASWIVDALLGTGTQGTLRDFYRRAIQTMNRSQRPIFAIDLPSGLDCDLGTPIDTAPDACIVATVTATFVARKLGFESPTSRQFTGDVRVIDIGVPHQMFAAK